MEIDICYENLANAIVTQAANDYRDLLTGNISQSPIVNFHELTKFFTSEWFKLLTTVDGEYLMERLEKELYV